jgi:hypothetical protein
MTEVINLLFNPLPNAIMTVLTGLSLLYWLFTMLMGDGFDFGPDADIQIEGADIQDVELNVDQELDSEITHEPSFISKAMDFIYVGKAPLMVIVTMFKFISWILTIVSSIIFNFCFHFF